MNKCRCEYDYHNGIIFRHSNEQCPMPGHEKSEQIA